MKICHVTDTHFSPLSHIPESRSLDFVKHVTNKINAFIDQVHDNEVDYVIHTGDIFHLKTSSRYSPEDINYFSSLFSRLKTPVFSIPGNHDLQRSSFDNIEKSAYKTFVSATNWYDISYQWVELDSDFGVPIRLYGFPYRPLDIFLEDLASVNEQNTERQSLNIALVHCDAIPDLNGLNILYKMVDYETLLSIGSNFHIFLQGHIHQSFPIYKNVETKQIISKPWSFMRAAKDYYVTTEILEFQHRPSWSMFTFGSSGNVDVKYVEIPVEPFNVAFDGDGLKKQLQDNYKIKSFLESIKLSTENGDNPFKIQSPEDVLKSMSIDREVLELINEYLGR